MFALFVASLLGCSAVLFAAAAERLRWERNGRGTGGCTFWAIVMLVTAITTARYL